jgi:hypothetical protein
MWYPVQLSEVPQVVQRRQPLVQAAITAKDVTHTPPDGSGIICHVETEYDRSASRRQQQRCQDLDGRRLTGTIRTEQAEELAFLDVETDVLECFDLFDGWAQQSYAGSVGAVQLSDLYH